MGESRIDIPQTEDEGGKTIHSSMLKRGKAIFSSMLKRGKAILVNRPGSSQPPEKANYHRLPLGLFHRLPENFENIENIENFENIENIESKLLARDRQCNFEELVKNLARDRQCNFEELVKNMIDDTPKIREWYVGDERLYSDEDLGRMMARSGLLLLEFLRILVDLQIERSSFMTTQFFHDYSVQEAVIKIDNQIPFFVLKKILEWERDENRQADTDLDSILKHAWLKLSPIQYDSPDSHVIAGVQLKDDSHLLEFLYENIIGSSDFKHASNWRKIKRRVRHISLLHVEQLQGEGVTFAPNEGLLNKIRFDRRNRTLYLPTIKMDGGTAAVLRNLVLFEASKQEKRSQPLMSYVDLMERLIDTPEDVRALRDGGIIHLGTDNAQVWNGDVAKVWNGMRRLLPNKKIKYEPIDNAIYDVTRFYTSRVESCRIMFKQSCSSKPWIVLAVAQTYLAWEQVRLQRESMPKT